MTVNLADGRELVCPHCRGRIWHEIGAVLTFQRVDPDEVIRSSDRSIRAAVCAGCGHLELWLPAPAEVEAFARSRRQAEAAGAPVPPRRPPRRIDPAET